MYCISIEGCTLGPRETGGLLPEGKEPFSDRKSKGAAADAAFSTSKALEQLSGKKRNPNPNFLVRMSSGGVGVFHVKGWGPKSPVCPSKPTETKLLGGISRHFCRDIGGARKV